MQIEMFLFKEPQITLMVYVSVFSLKIREKKGLENIQMY